MQETARGLCGVSYNTVCHSKMLFKKMPAVRIELTTSGFLTPMVSWGRPSVDVRVL